MRISETILESEAQIKTDPYNPPSPYCSCQRHIWRREMRKGRERLLQSKGDCHPKTPPSILNGEGFARSWAWPDRRENLMNRRLLLSPNNPEYHFRLALLYHEKGAWERTLKHLQKTVSLSPKMLMQKRCLPPSMKRWDLKDRPLQFMERRERLIWSFRPFHLISPTKI